MENKHFDNYYSDLDLKLSLDQHMNKSMRYFSLTFLHVGVALASNFSHDITVKL